MNMNIPDKYPAEWLRIVPRYVKLVPKYDASREEYDGTLADNSLLKTFLINFIARPELQSGMAGSLFTASEFSTMLAHTILRAYDTLVNIGLDYTGGYSRFHQAAQQCVKNSTQLPMIGILVKDEQKAKRYIDVGFTVEDPRKLKNPQRESVEKIYKAIKKVHPKCRDLKVKVEEAPRGNRRPAEKSDLIEAARKQFASQLREMYRRKFEDLRFKEDGEVKGKKLVEPRNAQRRAAYRQVMGLQRPGSGTVIPPLPNSEKSDEH